MQSNSVPTDETNSTSTDDILTSQFGFIKSGLYAGHYMKITSENKKCRRYNMMLVSANGTFIRRKDGAVVHTALARASFAVLGFVNDPAEIDLEAVLEQLKCSDLSTIRKELLENEVQLQNYPPKPVKSLANSNKSAVNGCKTPCKSRFVNESSPTDIMDESRNNLYWVRCSSSSAPELDSSDDSGYACLWYGGGEEITATTTVEVLMVSLPTTGSIKCKYDITHGDSTGVVEPSVLQVERNKLIPLDEQLISQVTSEVDVMAYLSALMLFAEWADSCRDSFIWPAFIIGMFQSEDMTKELFDTANSHALNKCRICHDDKCFVFLFILAARHIGVLDQFRSDSYLSHNECPVDIIQLMHQLSLIRVSNDTTFRSSSRVGADYQSDDLQCSIDMSDTIEVKSAVFVPHTDNHENDVDLQLQKFLGNVQLLRIRSVLVDEMVEAPVNVVEFTALVAAAFSRRKSALNASLEDREDAALASYMWSQCVDQVLAENRIRGRKLTAVSRVSQRIQYLSDSTTTTANNAVGGYIDALVEAPSDIEKKLIFTVPDDVCMEIYYSHDGDSLRALSAVEKLLCCVAESTNSDEFSLNSDAAVVECKRITLSTIEFKIFLVAIKRYHHNLRKVWRKFNRTCQKYFGAASLQAGTVATAPVQSSTDKGEEGKMSVEQGDSAVSVTAVATVAETSTEWNRSLDFPIVMQLFMLLLPGDEQSVLARLSTDGNNSSSSAQLVARHQPLQWNHFTSGASNHSAPAKSTARLVPPKLFVLKRSVSDVDDSNGRRDPNIPNRWPVSLPLMSHNLYWLKTSNSPCLCVGLDNSLSARTTTGDGSLSVITICCATYHSAVSVQASKLEPLDEDIVKQCSDERAVGFALAMMDFADWELLKLPAESPLRKWYVYPSFIRKFLQHMPTFASWRKQAERAGRDFKDRRKMYFNALLETFHSNVEVEMRDDRFTMVSFPWDTTELLPLSTVATNETNEITHQQQGIDNIGVGALTVLMKRKAESCGSMLKVLEPAKLNDKQPRLSELNILSVRRTPAVSPSLYNMFWISKASLPCIYYDSIDNRYNDKITVLPICCSTYHYPVEAMQSFLEPLTSDKLKLCTDDRTRDFTIALHNFADWESKFLVSTGEFSDSVNTDVQSDPLTTAGSDFYEWPHFILDMLNQPKEWASWRNRVEGETSAEQQQQQQQGIAVSQLYFEALCQDYRAEVNSVQGSSVISTNDSMSTNDVTIS